MKKFIAFYFILSIFLWANSNVELNVSKGWNLISTPVDKNISDFLIFDNFELIWIYKNANWIKNPKTIESGKGFWVNMEQNKTLNFSGKPYSISEKLFNLKSSWELLGSAKEFENRLFNTIWSFKNSKWIKNPKTIQIGEGFWIKDYDRDLTLGVLKEKEKIIPKVDTYSLPITSMDEILNFQRDIEKKLDINLSNEAKEKLLQNGFVVIPSKFNRFKDVYNKLKSTASTKYIYYNTQEEVEPDEATPIYITVDSIMHLYHIYFQEALKYIEVNYFISDLKEMIESLIEYHKNYSFSDSEFQKAKELNLAYLSVIMKLLVPEYEPISSVKELVNREINKIENSSEINASEIFTNNCPFNKKTMCKDKSSMFFGDLNRTQECYCEDFTQYIPRGHYTTNEELQKYFKAMMYLGRMSFLTKYDRPTIGAMLLVDSLNSATTNNNQKAIDIWSKIYKVTSFFVGTSDDLLPYEYNSAFIQTFGEDAKITTLSENMEKFTQKLNELRDPSILGGFKNALLDTSSETKGLRLMGVRFIPDAYILSEVVGEKAGIWETHPQKETILKYAEDNYGYVEKCLNLTQKNPLEFGNEEMACACSAGNELKYFEFCRKLPSGLDVMNIMGSSLAKEIQESRDYKYVQLEATHKRLISEFDKFTLKDFSQNSYFGWLYMLKPLIEDFGEGWPIYMQTKIWRELMLNSSLASWSELRHDTILYAKQSYTEYEFMTGSPAPQKPIQPKYYGYVEPIPEFYSRVLNLTEMMIDGLNNFNLTNIANSLYSGKSMIERLYNISIKELNGEELSEDDYDYIKSISDTFSGAINSLAQAVTYVENSCNNTRGIACISSTQMIGDPYDTRIVADVHTDPNTQSILEVATAGVDYLIVVRRVSNGTLGASIGPVFNYREFSYPMNNRLKDEEWRELLLKESDKGLPEWITYKSKEVE